MAMNWPEKVPILEADDICRRNYHRPDNTHCLLGWCSVVFGIDAEGELVRKRLQNEVKLLDCMCCGNVAEFNDDKRNRKEKVASVWNRVMRQLGYTVPCKR